MRVLKWWELPPRARRILNPYDGFAKIHGTTSACAENTEAGRHPHHQHWNYLRVRGEYLPPHGMRLKCLELPPRARRIPVSGTKAAGFTGTTSACAENTLHVGFHILGNRNYLRVRGEYLEIASHAVIIQELPPRARRIQDSWYATDSGNGTTSACAENTWCSGRVGPAQGNYLRVRGEYTTDEPIDTLTGELPPRARRILYLLERGETHVGTTSACAENTILTERLFHDFWNYLRVRGEYPK